MVALYVCALLGWGWGSCVTCSNSTLYIYFLDSRDSIRYTRKNKRTLFHIGLVIMCFQSTCCSGCREEEDQFEVHGKVWSSS